MKEHVDRFNSALDEFRCACEAGQINPVMAAAFMEAGLKMIRPVPMEHFSDAWCGKKAKPAKKKAVAKAPAVKKNVKKKKATKAVKKSATKKGGRKRK